MANKKSYILRIDQKLFDVLEKWATDEFRSTNAQIEYLLHQAAMKSKRLKEKKTEN